MKCIEWSAGYFMKRFFRVGACKALHLLDKCTASMDNSSLFYLKIFLAVYNEGSVSEFNEERSVSHVGGGLRDVRQCIEGSRAATAMNNMEY